jgi:DNA uptake protein ComE-like DNA-binding protein
LLFALLIYASIRLYVNRGYVSDPQPAEPAHAAELADKIDPNTADADTLAVLPLIGPKRAADMVAYREQFLKQHPGAVAFKSLNDLMRIKGIGFTTIDQLSPYLSFPSAKQIPTTSTTRPDRASS